MGYTTKFKGKLSFASEPKASELAELNTILGEDCREHSEWGHTGLSYIDLEITKDFTGLEWNGAEKTYDLVDKVNVVIEIMKNKYPKFGLTGELIAHGEEPGDVWKLVMENNVAYERKIEPASKIKKVTCPNCKHKFKLEDDKFTFVFTGFRDENKQQQLEDMGHKVVDNVTKETTHLVMLSTLRVTTKSIKAKEFGCEIWSVDNLDEYLLES